MIKHPAFKSSLYVFQFSLGICLNPDTAVHELEVCLHYHTLRLHIIIPRTSPIQIADKIRSVHEKLRGSFTREVLH